MKPPETIKTKRLILRKLLPEDADAIFVAYAQDREVTKYLLWRPHAAVGETREFVKSRIAAWQDESEFTWAICLSDGSLIGGIALRVICFKTDLGYVLARPYWGKGYMPEALRALVDWALGQPEIIRIWAVCDVENSASARVMEKVGMKKEGILRRWMIHPQMGDKPRDCLCYSVVK